MNTSSLAGGYSSEPRATKDIDLFIRSEKLNSEAVYRALAYFGAPIAGLTPADFCDHPTSIFQIGYAPVRSDILQAIDGVNFDEAWRQRAEFTLDGIQVCVISAEHLIQNKLASGRLQDLADVEAIRAAEKAGGDGHK